MIIDVTQDDIDKGERHNMRACPIALALDRATGHDDWNVPTNAPDTLGFRQWVLDFDAGLPVQPFSFDFPDERRDEDPDTYSTLVATR